MAANPINARSKAIDIKYHYVRGCVKSMDIRFKFVPTLHQQADLLTKSLPSPAVVRSQLRHGGRGLRLGGGGRFYGRWDG